MSKQMALVSGVPIAGQFEPALNGYHPDTPSHAVFAPQQPLVPVTQEDWEAKKAVIEDLYLNQNRSLKDVVDVMLTEHNFKATERMFKHQFLKWNWSKYITKRRQADIESGRDFRRVAGKSCVRTSNKKRQRVVASPAAGAVGGDEGPKQEGLQRAAVPSRAAYDQAAVLFLQYRQRQAQLARTLHHGNDVSRQMDITFTTINRYLCGTAEADVVRWATTSKFKYVHDWDSATNLLNEFLGSLEAFNRNDVAQGGHTIRAAFLNMEGAIRENSTSTFWYMCFLIPDCILKMKHIKIMRVYTAHMKQLFGYTMRDHPLLPFATSLQYLVNHHVDRVPEYLFTASELWADTVSSIRGPVDKNTLDARMVSTWLQGSSTKESIVQMLIPGYEQLIAEADMELGDLDPLTMQAIDDMLMLQNNARVWGRAFGDWCAVFLDRLRRLNGDRPVGYGAWRDGDVDRYNAVYWCLWKYWSVSVGDKNRSADCLKMCCEDYRSTMSLRRLSMLEENLREVGRGDEADEIRDKRLAMQVVEAPSVVDIAEELKVEEEEAEDSDA